MQTTLAGAEVGHTAPPLDLRLRAGRVAFDRFAGQTVVLAIFDAWHPGGAALERIRAELRGLGAAMIVVSDGVWCFGADDDVELAVAAADLPRGTLDTLRRDWGVTKHGAPDERFAVFVVDAEGVVRFARRDVVGKAPGEDTLAAALAKARRALLSPPPISGGITRRELLDACVVAGFFAAIASCSRSSLGPTKGAPPAYHD